MNAGSGTLVHFMPTTKHGYKIKRLTMLQNEMKYGRMTVNSFSENEATL